MGLVSPSTLSFVAAASGAWIAYKILSIGSRESDLPPGPPTVPILGNVLLFPKENPHATFSKWAQMYGEIFSFKIASHNLIVLTSPQACREVLDKQSAITSDRPPHFIGDVITDGLHLPFVRQGPTWKTLRRTVRDILSPQACAKHLNVQKAESARLMYDLLREPEGHYRHFQRYALSVIMCVTFGQATVNIDSPEAQTFVKNAHDFNHIMGPGETPPIDLIPWLKYVPERWAPWKTACRDIRRRHKEFYTKLMKPCRDRALNGEENTSFMQSVCEREAAMGMTPDMTLLLGQAILETGSDTSGAYLQNATLLLLAHPHVQRKAHEELDRVIGNDRAPTLDDMDDLPYINAIIQEIHRLRPVAPMAIPHANVEDLTYKGYRIPKGSMIIPNVYGIFEQPSLYDSPDQFDPDRYMNQPLGLGKGVDQTPVANLKDFVYGFGKRACPGIILAKNTVALNVVNLLWGFDITPAIGLDGKPIEPDLKSFKPQIVLVTPPFECQIKPRSSRHAEMMTQAFLDYTAISQAFEHELTDDDKKFMQDLRDEAATSLRTAKA